jgi:hypothetical protein
VLAGAAVAGRAGGAGALARWAVAAAAGTVAVWWVTTGSVPWRIWPVAVAVGALVAAARAGTPSRALLAAPGAAVGVAVALHALPWPALLVAAALPAARHAAVTADRRPPRRGSPPCS